MTNQHPTPGWAPGQQPAGGAPSGGASVPPAQYGSPQRPQGFPTAPQNPGVPQGQRPPSAGVVAVGPFTLRELIIFIASFLLLITSFLPTFSSDMGSNSTLWTPLWPIAIPCVLLPCASAILVLIRRLAPGLRLRVGSLSVDQFASATAITAVSAHLVLILLVTSFGQTLLFSASVSFGPLLGVLFSLVLLVVTTLSTFIPPFSADFRDRDAVDAHVTARQPRAIVRAPRPAPMPGYQAPSPYPQPGGYGQPLGQAVPAAGQPMPQQMPYSPPAPQNSAPAAPAPNPYAHPQAPQPDAAPPRDAAASAMPPHRAADSNIPPAEHEAQQAEAGQHEPGAEQRMAPGIPEDTIIRDRAESSAGVDAAPTDADTRADPDRAEAGGPTETDDADSAAPVTAADHVNEAAPVSSAPYWVWSPRPRAVTDDATGEPVFEIGPEAWALAVDDRGDVLVIRHDDGRVGILNDVDGLTRG